MFKNNNKGNTIVYISIAVLIVAVISVGFYLYSKDKTKKENVAKLEKLDKELLRLLDKDNFVTYGGGTVTPKNRSQIVSTLDDIEKNNKDYDKTFNLVFKSFEAGFCGSKRKVAVNSMIDTLTKTFVSSGYGNNEREHEAYYRNADNNMDQFKREYKRECENVYQKEGLEFNL